MKKGKKLIIHFGGIWSKEEISIEETNQGDSTKQLRKKIMQGLNKSRELQAVSDLMPQDSYGSYFDPIMFTMHVPLSLQTRDGNLELDNNTYPEDFECVYDGCCLFIASLVDIDTYPHSPLCVRDRFFSILNSITKSEKVPPCLFPGSITFVCHKDPFLNKNSIEYFAACKENTQSKEILSFVLDEIGFQMGDFMNLLL